MGTCQRLVAERGLTLVHPFDHPAIVAGHATAGLEIVADLPTVDLVVVPVGGGGLISGVASAVRRRCPHRRVVGVEPDGADVVSRSLEAGEPVVQAGPTVHCGRTDRPDHRRGPVRAHQCPLWTRWCGCPTTRSWTRCAILLREEGVPAEPAGAAGLAALLSRAVPVTPGQHIVLVISGGNVDPDLLARLTA